LIGSTTDPGSHPGADTDGSVVITPAAAGVGCAPVLQVKKVVSGPATAGFSVHVECVAAPTPTLTTATVASTTADLPYGSDGSPTAAGAPSGWVVSNGTWEFAQASLVNSTCTATETNSGGAASVSYSCSWTPGASDHIASVGCPGESSGPSATAASVTFEGNGDTGVLAVTNTFPAAQAVAVQPKFTG
jgi:hypothetical protein